MPYGPKIEKSINFKAVLNFKKGSRIEVQLKNQAEKPLSMTLIYNRNLLPAKDLEYFIKLKKQGFKTYTGVGFKLRF